MAAKRKDVNDMRRRREPLHDNGIDSIVLEMRFLKAVLNSEQTGSVVGKKESNQWRIKASQAASRQCTYFNVLSTKVSC